MEDAEIIELYFKRSENAIEESRRKYDDYLVSISENILQNRQNAEECVCDAYVRAWNSIPPQNPVCFRAFLACITRNLSLDCYIDRAVVYTDRIDVFYKVALPENDAAYRFESDIGRDEVRKCWSKAG